MTERLSDIEARIGSVHQLAAVVTAMRGIAAARSREARDHLAGMRAYSNVIAGAIGEALALLPEASADLSPERMAGRHAIVALCAEQGFVGSFNDRVLGEVASLAAADTAAGFEILLAGDRGLMAAAERGMAVDWSASMIAHAGQAADLADRIVKALYDRIDTGRVTRVTIVHAVPGLSAEFHIVKRKLVPFDYERFETVATMDRPLVNLQPQALVTQLAEEYIYAELCEAVILSFAAENDARTRAMIAARANVTKTLGELVARSRRLRQEEITDEIMELASGTAPQL